MPPRCPLHCHFAQEGHRSQEGRDSHTPTPPPPSPPQSQTLPILVLLMGRIKPTQTSVPRSQQQRWQRTPCRAGLMPQLFLLLLLPPEAVLHLPGCCELRHHPLHSRSGLPQHLCHRAWVSPRAALPPVHVHPPCQLIPSWGRATSVPRRDEALGAAHPAPTHPSRKRGVNSQLHPCADVS